MTAIVKRPPSPPRSSGELDSQYTVRHLNGSTTRIPHNIQTSGWDFDSTSVHLSPAQQSYYHSSTPGSQDLFTGRSGYFPADQAQYIADESPDGYRDYGPSDDMTPSSLVAQNANVNMGMLQNLEYGIIDSGYHDSSQENSAQNCQHFSVGPNGTYNLYVENMIPSPSPSLNSPRRTTRSGANGARTINHKNPVITKTSPTGQVQKVTKVCKAPRKRKASGDKAERPKLPKLIKPLSELTRDYHHIPVKDMEAWVHRSPETRREEVMIRNGYVPRPMNSFMLYRSAFAERTKLWCLQNNHQVVSSVSGESWPLEPVSIRERYNDYAKIERNNHQAAHPGYKFSPSKAQNSRKRRPKGEEAEASELEGPLDDEDYTGSVNGGRAQKAVRGKKALSAANYDQSAGNHPMSAYMGLSYDHIEGGAQRSSFMHNNPGKTPPMCMGSTDMNGQYYETTVRASSATPIANPLYQAVIEDVTIRKTQAPLGSAGMHHGNSMNSYQQSLQISQESHDNSKVDPALLGEDPLAVYRNSQYQNATGHEMLPSQFVDEGHYEDGNFETELLFTAASGPQISELHYPDGGAPPESFEQFEGSLLDSGIDVQKLPGYDQSMQGFLDNQEPWSVTEEAGPEGGDQFRYEEWLQ